MNEQEKVHITIFQAPFASLMDLGLYMKMHDPSRPFADTVPAEYYLAVFDGEIECPNPLPKDKERRTYTILEKVFSIFNNNLPTGYCSRSLSVGDVVQLEGLHYLCVTCGFRPVIFTTSQRSTAATEPQTCTLTMSDCEYRYGSGQPLQPAVPGRRGTPHMDRIYLPQLLPLEEYEKIIVLFSGGKDSLACVLNLLERGVPRERIELWHHDIDGGHPDRRMDWPVTQAYVRAISEYLGLVLRTSWRVNGFWGEVYRIGASWPIQYVEPDSGIVRECRLSEKQIRSAHLRETILSSVERTELEQMGHRMKFPAKSGNLATRWCSSILKIMVADTVIRNIALDELKQIGDCRKFPAKGSISNGRYCSPNLKREVADTLIRSVDGLRADGERMKFPAKSGCHQGRWCSGALKAQVEDKLYSHIEDIARDTRLLIVSGERRQESAGRSKYNEMEIHRTNATARAHRLVHQWRSVIDWDEARIWEIIKRWHIAPHPCYAAGWNRCSCAMCIFSLPRHWAGIRELFPDWVSAVEEDERILGFTLDNKMTLAEYIGDAESCVCHDDPKALLQLTSGIFSLDDVEQAEWKLPAGAFRGAEGGPC